MRKHIGMTTDFMKHIGFGGVFRVAGPADELGRRKHPSGQGAKELGATYCARDRCIPKAGKNLKPSGYLCKLRDLVRGQIKRLGSGTNG